MSNSAWVNTPSSRSRFRFSSWVTMSLDTPAGLAGGATGATGWALLGLLGLQLADLPVLVLVLGLGLGRLLRSDVLAAAPPLRRPFRWSSSSHWHVATCFLILIELHREAPLRWLWPRR
ncbi:MAG: hypothetical protein R2789_09850 [Microthrixaceae bacterium]